MGTVQTTTKAETKQRGETRYLLLQQDASDIRLRRERQLDDEELDSGDDMDRNDRVGSASPRAEPEQQEEEIVQYAECARQPVPEPSDGEVCPG